MLKNVLKASVLSAVCLLSGLANAPAATAMTPDYSCYMQIGSKRVVDLTKSVCGFYPEKAAKAAATDAAYLKAIKKLVNGDTRVTDLMANNPGLFTQAAQEYCAIRQSGVSEQQFFESRYREIMLQAGEPNLANPSSEQMQQYENLMMASSIAVQLAPPHYCPNLNRG
jgi:hypothetical protein